MKSKTSPKKTLKPASIDQVDLERLNERLASLEQQLTTIEKEASGRGAYSGSSPSISGWGGAPSILQQLHRSREALSEVRDEVAALNKPLLLN